MNIMYLASILSLSLLITSCSSAPPLQLGETLQGTLQPCPASPNCVSSSSLGMNYIPPISDAGANNSLLKLSLCLKQMENVKIIESNNMYLHAEFKSTVFGFIDDVELLRQGNLIHVRSASRVGYSDFGVNRDRMIWLKRHFIEGCSAL
ncbi:DUF1499 domain-containing protein [Oceaniserpentilla sp. 4NH20-0058]|uniref:DUF1499 domain-containing protein n=1 Tax=Oceaniserpentilla sp. 4NH20-0058 TaxID=3127660 RepID=UPI0033410177